MMSQPAKSHEPSMEEILASIRRIIADDDAKPDSESAAPTPPPVIERPKSPLPSSASVRPTPPPAKPAAPKAPESPVAVSNSQDDIDSLLAGLDADTSSSEVRPPADAPANDVLELTEQMEVEVEDKSGFRNIQANDDIEFAEMSPAPPPPPERPRTVAPMPSFVEPEPATPQQPLMSASTVGAVNSAFNALAQTVLSNNARTLEDLVKEMLRPMLKGWLDDNLPGLVEKIVRAEIERVSRGR